MPVDLVSAGVTTALAECAILIGMDVDELQHALGGIVLEAAYLERVLRARTPDEVRRLADQPAAAAGDLAAAMTAALGPDWGRLEDQLRRELGHDVNADLGR